MEAHELTAAQARLLIGRRELSCEELTRSCLRRVRERDPEIRAWVAVDADRAVRLARELDKRGAGGPLNGLPVGFKDVIATADLPTSYNAEVYADHHGGRDAACVTVVRHSGGLVFGKTDTVEFAVGTRKALTRNPHNLAHTPGGSSSGSAAAVADRHVPLAFGSQTGGSVIRPAAYCGVYAIKPTHGVVSDEGVKEVSPSLDTLGWFARSVEDLSLVAAAFRLPGLENAAEPAGTRGLRVGFCGTPMWEHAEEGARLAAETAIGRLAAAGCEILEVELPQPFDRLGEACDTIVGSEGRAAFLSEYLAHGPRLDPHLRGVVENVKGRTWRQLADAHDMAAACRPVFDRLFEPGGIDVVVTPSAPGEAPEGLHSTGSWVFNALWTLLHVPCVAVPVGLGAAGLPLGVQLVGPRFSDLALLRTAEALAPVLDVAGPIDASARAMGRPLSG